MKVVVHQCFRYKDIFEVLFLISIAPCIDWFFLQTALSSEVRVFISVSQKVLYFLSWFVLLLFNHVV